MRHRSGWSGSLRSYLDVFPHAAGQHSHQYRYCGMSHFLASFCLPLLLSVLRVEVAVVFLKKKKWVDSSNALCLVTSAEVMDTASVGAFLRYLLRLRPGSLFADGLSNGSLGFYGGWSLTEPSPVSAGVHHRLCSRRALAVAWWGETSGGGALRVHGGARLLSFPATVWREGPEKITHGPFKNRNGPQSWTTVCSVCRLGDGRETWGSTTENHTVKDV